MPAGWIDDEFSEHAKRELVDCAVDGLLMRAISRACKLKTDGWVEASWARKQRGATKRVIDLAVEHRILEPLKAGGTRRIRGRVRIGLRRNELEIIVGPFAIDGFVIHDFLDCNRARCEVEKRRQDDRLRQREHRAGRQQEPLPWADLPPDNSSVSRVTSDGRPSDVSVSGSTPTSEAESNDARAHARSGSPIVQKALDILHQADRLHIDAIAVENAIIANPHGDATKAARRVLAWGTDPAWWITNAATLMWKAYAEQEKGLVGNGRRKDRPTAADFQALKTVEGSV